MLNKLHLRNFRAFRSQPFSFSKLNIFVGPNNSGKSSAISAINLCAQTTLYSDLDETPLLINGQFDKLGTFLDIVHGHRSNTPLGLDLCIDDISLSLDYKYRQQRREIELVRCELLDAGRPAFLYQTRKDSFVLKLGGKDFEALAPNLRKRRPVFRGFLPVTRNISMLNLERENVSLSEGDARIWRAAERSIIKARVRLRDTFSKFDSLGPFRERPERTYLYSGETAQTIGTSGDNTAVILSSDAAKRGSESRDMAEEISRWFKVAGIAEALKVRPLTPRHFEIVLTEASGTEHNICDVGFGCSQVLPVLTGALNLFNGFDQETRQPSPTLILQEPEIHLHPNAQAALGSFFAGLLRSDGQLFIETHSDNLVLRIARHVADGTLTPDDVRIFYVHKKKGQSVVHSLQVQKDGTFTQEWPGGFFPQRQAESLQLAQEGFRASGKGRGRQLEFKYPEERR